MSLVTATLYNHATNKQIMEGSEESEESGGKYQKLQNLIRNLVRDKSSREISIFADFRKLAQKISGFFQLANVSSLESSSNHLTSINNGLSFMEFARRTLAPT